MGVHAYDRITLRLNISKLIWGGSVAMAMAMMVWRLFRIKSEIFHEEYY